MTYDYSRPIKKLPRENAESHLYLHYFLTYMKQFRDASVMGCLLYCKKTPAPVYPDPWTPRNYLHRSGTLTMLLIRKVLTKITAKGTSRNCKVKSAEYFSAELIKAFHSLPLQTANVEAEMRDYLWFIGVEH